ncbi:MAG: DUF4190 domain-containing protein [Nocardioides sp.]
MTTPPSPPPPSYGAPGYGGYGPPAPNHPQATTVLVLGILGIVVCGLVGPFAWSMGNGVVREIDASGGQWGGRTEANVGRVLGIVATCLLVLSVLLFAGFLAFSGAMFAGFMHP